MHWILFAGLVPAGINLLFNMLGCRLIFVNNFAFGPHVDHQVFFNYSDFNEKMVPYIKFI